MASSANTRVPAPASVIRALAPEVPIWRMPSALSLFCTVRVAPSSSASKPPPSTTALPAAVTFDADRRVSELSAPTTSGICSPSP
jgi:hypothetical protein